MGIHGAFSKKSANFSGMTALTTGNLYINSVAHDTYIKVYEKGTETAAVTVIGVGLQASKTNTILFLGVVTDLQGG